MSEDKNSGIDLRYAIPGTLDAPPRFLWWDLDQALLYLGLVLLGIVSNFSLGGILMGAVVGWLYGKTKSGRHRAFMVHLMYWHLPSDLASNFRETPPSHQRKYLG